MYLIKEENIMNKKELKEKIADVFGNPLVLKGYSSEQIDDYLEENNEIIQSIHDLGIFKPDFLRYNVFIPRALWLLNKQYDFLDFSFDKLYDTVAVYLKVTDSSTGISRTVTVLINDKISTNIGAVGGMSTFECESFIIELITKAWLSTVNDVVMLSLFYSDIRTNWTNSYFDGFYLNPKKTRIELNNETSRHEMDITHKHIRICNEIEHMDVLMALANNFNENMLKLSPYYKRKKIILVSSIK